MNPKTLYEKPRAELLSFHLEDELMSGAGATVNVISVGGNPGTGADGGPRPMSDGLNDKSSYQLD